MKTSKHLDSYPQPWGVDDTFVANIHNELEFLHNIHPKNESPVAVCQLFS